MTNTDRLQLLTRAIQHEDTNGKGGGSRVASKIGVSPSTISQIVNGKYPVEPEAVLAKIEHHYAFLAEDRHCPACSQQISAESCVRNQAQTKTQNLLGLLLRTNCPRCQYGG